jgi:hypothetical protein
MKSLISQRKKSVESLSCILNQIEDRISGLEDKVHVLEHADEDREKIKIGTQEGDWDR